MIFILMLNNIDCVAPATRVIIGLVNNNTNIWNVLFALQIEHIHSRKTTYYFEFK